ncbi:hypothetical protein MTO96_017528 [Rhipicephalus appendiculatus]
MPPTVLTRPPALSNSSSYKQDLTAAADTINKLISRGVAAFWAVSVSMKGRWTVLKAGQSVDFLAECEHDPKAESFGSVAQVCNNRSFRAQVQYKSGVRGKLFYHQSNGRVFAFDNDSTLVQKVCRLRLQLLSVPFGVAAFDIDYDDFSGVCSWRDNHKPFARLVILREVLVYFQEIFRTSYYLDHCLSIEE